MFYVVYCIKILNNMNKQLLILFPLLFFTFLCNSQTYIIVPIHQPIIEECLTNDINIKPSFNIYPNPASDKLNVFIENVEKSGDLQLEIINLFGETLYKINKIIFNNFEAEIDVSSFSKGSYFIKVTGKQFSVSKKVLIE